MQSISLYLFPVCFHIFWYFQFCFVCLLVYLLVVGFCKVRQMKHFIPLPKKPQKSTRTQNKRAGQLSGCTRWNHLAPRFPVEEHFELVGCGVSCIDELYDHYLCIQRFMMSGFSFVCLFWEISNMVKHMYIADFEIKCTGERVDITWANPQRKNGHHSEKALF